MSEQNEQLERGRFEGEVLSRLTSIENKLAEIKETAARADTKANFAAELASSASTTQADHEARLRAIEERNAKESGRASVISAAIAASISIISVAIQWLKPQ